MKRCIARFIGDTYCYIAKLYQSGPEQGWEMVEREEWNGLKNEIAPFDHSLSP